MRLLGTAAVMLLGMAPGAAAQAQVPRQDAGSTRTAFSERGTTITTSTARNGEHRCVAVRGHISMCSAGDGRRNGATLIGHTVSRDGDRRIVGPLVIAGLAGDDATRVRLRWDGGSRVVRPKRFGAYGAVLPSAVRHRTVRISVRYRRGDVDTMGYDRPRRRMTYVEGSERVDLKMPDPYDGRTLGLLTWKTKQGQLCNQLGDLVSGRVGSLRGTWFAEYPVNMGGSCSRVAGSSEPLAFGVTTAGERSWISGFARADVAAVEIKAGDGPFQRTRLSARRAFARAFRDPQALTVAAILRDGRRVEKVLPAPPPLPLPPVQASRP